VTPWTCIVYAECASKANSRKFALVRGKPMFIKAEKALAFEKAAVAMMWLKRPAAPFDCDLKVTCRIYYPTRRNDLDPSLCWDCLQKAGVIANDRLLKEQHIHWGLDPAQPRVEITLEELVA